MKKITLSILLLISVFSFSISSYAADDSLIENERILNFNSDITVNKDSTLNVVEKITVYADGVSKIKHGIYRDFPTIYKDDYGNNYKVKLSIISIKKDGLEETYKTESLSNGIRIYIGKSDTIIGQGTYTYEISYNVTKELGFFESEDVLYWNVTGNGWPFSMDTAEATVHLPEGVPFDKLSISAYTGYQGMKGQDFYSTTTEKYVYFNTTQKLEPTQGLTIAVGWPKGYVQEPTKQQKFQSVLLDNIGIIVGIISIILIILYYLIAWLMVGRDPKKGSIIAEYEAPENLSPAELRFNFIEGYDNEVFTSAIISMAVKGYLKIYKINTDYILVKNEEGDCKLSPEENIVSDVIFMISNKVNVSEVNYSKFQSAESALKKVLEKKFLNSYFIVNSKVFKIGIAISIFLFILTTLFNELNFLVYIFISFWVAIWSVVTFSITNIAIKNLRSETKVAVVQIIFAIPFIILEVIGLGVLVKNTSLFFVIFLTTFIIINIFFFKALKRRTVLGRTLEDKIEGFRMFLSVTEEDRLNFTNPPEKTPELFEKFLPYALALGVEQRWSEKFSDILNNSSYKPDWYNGSTYSTFSTLSDFTRDIGSSLSDQISSSSHAPGSRSGGGSSSSHGGGSSGGGGGGGGGGGW